MSEFIFDIQRFATISNSVNDTIITGTSSDDSIVNYGKNVMIDGGKGNDTLMGDKGMDSILGGEGDDKIYGGKSNDILAGGDGADIFLYANGDGNDVITDYAEEDKIQIASGAVKSVKKSGSDVIFTVGKGKISLMNAADKIVSYIDANGAKKTYGSSGGDDEDEEDSKLITGTNGADDIENSISGATINALGGSDNINNGGYWDDDWHDGGSNVKIDGGKGNDFIKNWSSSVTIDGGDGNDYIDNRDSNVSIMGGDGNDTIENYASSSVTIDGGTGKDSIDNEGNNAKINGGAGDDTISNTRPSVTINAGADNDVISLHSYAENNLIQYSAGDGNDKIIGFNADDTLSISGGSYSTTKSGSNLIVTVGKGKISLMGAASLSKVNITGTKTVTETNTWKLNGTTATYGTTSKTLVTVKGVNSTAGLSIKGKVVTIAQAALNNSNVTVSNGYTLALANNVVKKATTGKPSWSYKDSVAAYVQTTSAYYTLAGNKKSITYKKATSKTLATVSGVKSASGIKVSGKVITVSNKIINKNTTVNGNGYEFKLAAGNTSITGSGNADKITNSGAKVTIAGGKGNDIISLASGAKNNVISYNNNDGNDIIYGFDSNDTLKISGTAKVTTSGADVVFTVGKGKITVKGAANKTFSYSDAGGNKTYSTVAPSPADSDNYTISNDGKGITLSNSYSSEEFDVTTVKNGGDKIVTIDASAVTHKLYIKGNELPNKIISANADSTLDGGKGGEKISDTLVGGKGSDVFVYYNGDGNDVISNYGTNDTIKIAKGTVEVSTDREDVILTVGNGKITVQDAVDKRITYIEDNIEYGCKNGEKTFSISETSKNTVATLSEYYWKDSFDLTTFGNKNVGESIDMINASAVTGSITIKGNKKSNKITCGTGNNTIIGGAGNDSIYGDDSANVYVYNDGDGHDHIYNYRDGDKIKITTSEVVSGSVASDKKTVVFNIGNRGKIYIEEAADKEIEYVVNGTTHIRSATDSKWFLADDTDYELTPRNDLSSLVQSKSADYSVAQESLTPKNNLMSTVTYSSKK